MRKSSLFVFIISLFLVCFSWFSYFKYKSELYVVYKEYVRLAEESCDAGLYQQAVENYYLALEYSNPETICPLIIDTYEKFYEEEHTKDVADLYIKELTKIIAMLPNEADYRYKKASLYMEYLNFREAFNVVSYSVRNNVSNEDIDDLYFELLRKNTVDHTTYVECRTSMNGYILALDTDNFWSVLDAKGKSITTGYTYIGRLNSDGAGLFINDIDTRFMESDLVPRCRYDFSFIDSTIYDADSNLIGVLTDEGWFYVDALGERLEGTFELASSFSDGVAVVMDNGQWYEIDTDGSTELIKDVEDIKLDLALNFINDGIVIAKIDGEYCICDNSFEPISDFSANNIDLYIDSYIAFESDGLWGFVDTEGDIVIEPKYTNAMSFSNGLAAVCNEDGYWGFIDEEDNLIVDYLYTEAGYFNSNRVALVREEGRSGVALLGFMFSEE